MTISADYEIVQGDGNAVTTAFPFGFPFFAASDIVVNLFDTATSLDVEPQPVLDGAAAYDYTVTGLADGDTGEYPNGTVTFNTAPPANYVVTIGRASALRQPVQLAKNGPLPAKSLEAAMDRLEMQMQELMATALRLRTADPEPARVPGKAARAGFVGGYALVTGDPVVSTVTLADLEAILTVGVPASTAKEAFIDTAVDLVVTAAMLAGGRLCIRVNTGGGNRRITIDPALMVSAALSAVIEVQKTSDDANQVLINNAVADVDAIVAASPADGIVKGYRTVRSDGAKLIIRGEG